MIEKPVIIIGAPRSGTTLLFRSLAAHPELWHLPSESHGILEGPFHPRHAGYSSNCVSADMLDEATSRRLSRSFYRAAINVNLIVKDPLALMSANTIIQRISHKASLFLIGALSKRQKPPIIRLLEKTPKNSLRVPMMGRLFPDARFLWITREPYANIRSIAAGWHQTDRIGPFRFNRFARAGYPILRVIKPSDYKGRRWKFALIPGWRKLEGRTIMDIAARQYYHCSRKAMEDLAAVDARRVKKITFEGLISDPEGIIRSILEWADLSGSSEVDSFVRDLPRVNESRMEPRQENQIRDADLSSAMGSIPGFHELIRSLKQ